MSRLFYHAQPAALKQYEIPGTGNVLTALQSVDKQSKVTAFSKNVNGVGTVIILQTEDGPKCLMDTNRKNSALTASSQPQGSTATGGYYDSQNNWALITAMLDTIRAKLYVGRLWEALGEDNDQRLIEMFVTSIEESGTLANVAVLHENAGWGNMCYLTTVVELEMSTAQADALIKAIEARAALSSREEIQTELLMRQQLVGDRQRPKFELASNPQAVIDVALQTHKLSESDAKEHNPPFNNIALAGLAACGGFSKKVFPNTISDEEFMEGLTDLTSASAATAVL